MAENPDEIKKLSERLDQILDRQRQLQVEIQGVRKAIEDLKRADPDTHPSATAPLASPPLKQNTPIEPVEAVSEETPSRWESLRIPSRSKQDWEKFIGENLISKIGILITVIGVAFGAKYAIDHDLISPLTRIVLGYLAGLGLIGVAMRLRTAYNNFSAVLLSGGLAILYIITYFAFSYYELIPQSLAFVLMALFTAFTVLAAWHYDRQIIALMGLVGAYGVPFLISEESGSATVLLGYMTLINGGILVIAFRKYWKALFATAFWLSWLIFAWWMIFGYEREQHFTTGLVFSTLFFLLFYAIIIANKLIKKEPYRWTDIVLLLANSFLYFGFGYGMLSDHPTGEQMLGIFALANAAIHFFVGRTIYRVELADRNLFYLVIGLVLVFITVAIPIQLDGNWVTLLWAGEAALLFWLGRSRQIVAYEKMALPLLLLAFGSLVQDWSAAYGEGFYSPQPEWLRPFWNMQMLNSLLVSGIFGLMVWFQSQERYTSTLPEKNLWRQALRFIIPGVFLVALYYSFRVEIDHYYRMRHFELVELGEVQPSINNSIYAHAGIVWGIYYSIVFLSVLSLINMRWIRNRLLGLFNLGLNVYAILFFMAGGLFSLSFLSEAYVITESGELILNTGFSYLRYLGYLLVAGLLFITYQYQRQDFIAFRNRWAFDAVLHPTALIILSVELVHLTSQAGALDADKLGLSILWGIYALFLIGLGIAQRKAYLRIGAIVLFAVTLIKLFFYDIVHLDTMAKTVVLLSLGVLLLIISFLYNKFKHLIADEPSI